MKYILYTLLIFAFISCGVDPHSNKEKFINVNINSDTLKYYKIKDIEFLYPHQIHTIDSFLVIRNREDVNYFDLYSLNSLSKIAVFGNEGRGRGEFLYPNVFKKEVLNDSAYLYIHDEFTRGIYKVNLQKIATKKEAIEQLEKLPNKLGMPEKIICYSDDTIICASDNEIDDARFTIYSYLNDEKKKIGYVPNLESGVSDVNKYIVYNTVDVCWNDSLKVFGVTSVMLGELDFFSKSGNFLHSSIIERQEKLKYANKEELLFKYSPITYQCKLRCHKGNIYMLYTKIVENGNFQNSELYKFDWSGSLIKKIAFNKVCISFDISDRDGYVYAIIYDNNKYTLAKCFLENEEF